MARGGRAASQRALVPSLARVRRCRVGSTFRCLARVSQAVQRETIWLIRVEPVCAVRTRQARNQYRTCTGARSFLPGKHLAGLLMRQSWSGLKQLHQLRLQTSHCVRRIHAVPLIGSAPLLCISRGRSFRSMTPGSTPNGRLAETAEPDPLAKTEDAEMTVRQTDRPRPLLHTPRPPSDNGPAMDSFRFLR